MHYNINITTGFKIVLLVSGKLLQGPYLKRVTDSCCCSLLLQVHVLHLDTLQGVQQASQQTFRSKLWLIILRMMPNIEHRIVISICSAPYMLHNIFMYYIVYLYYIFFTLFTFFPLYYSLVKMSWSIFCGHYNYYDKKKPK